LAFKAVLGIGLLGACLGVLASFDVWDVAATQRELDEELRKADLLDQRLRLLVECCYAKTWVTQQVIAERMSLWEAAARFRALDKQLPRELRMHPDLMAGESD